MTDNCIERDLFGQPVIRKAKKKKATPPPPAMKPSVSRQTWLTRLRAWLRRFTGDTAHQTAVNVAATLLAGAVLAGLAQLKWDWIGWSKKEIGDWITTVKPEN